MFHLAPLFLTLVTHRYSPGVLQCSSYRETPTRECFVLLSLFFPPRFPIPAKRRLYRHSYLHEFLLINLCIGRTFGCFSIETERDAESPRRWWCPHNCPYDSAPWIGLYIELCFLALSIALLPHAVPTCGDTQDTATWLLLWQIFRSPELCRWLALYTMVVDSCRWLALRRSFIGRSSLVAYIGGIMLK